MEFLNVMELGGEELLGDEEGLLLLLLHSLHYRLCAYSILREDEVKRLFRPALPLGLPRLSYFEVRRKKNRKRPTWQDRAIKESLASPNFFSHVRHEEKYGNNRITARLLLSTESQMASLYYLGWWLSRRCRYDERSLVCRVGRRRRWWRQLRLFDVTITLSAVVAAGGCSGCGGVVGGLGGWEERYVTVFWRYGTRNKKNT